MQAKLEACLRGADRLADLGDSQVALLLLTRCIAARPAYLLRGVVLDLDLRRLYEAYDRCLTKVVASLFESDEFSTPAGERAA